MENFEKGNIKTRNYFSSAMLLFLALSLDILVYIVVYSIISDGVLYKHLVSNALTIIIWSVAIFLSYRYIDKNEIKDIYSFDKDIKSIFLFGILIFLLIVINLIIKDLKTPYIIYEFSVFLDKYKQFGFVTYIIQNIYYLLEGMLITLIIMFGQTWGEKKFSNGKLPFGGLVLCLSWGLVHIFTQGIQTGIYASLISITIGIGFVYCKKNIIMTYLLVLVIFLI